MASKQAMLPMLPCPDLFLRGSIFCSTIWERFLRTCWNQSISPCFHRERHVLCFFPPKNPTETTRDESFALAQASSRLRKEIKVMTWIFLEKSEKCEHLSHRTSESVKSPEDFYAVLNSKNISKFARRAHLSPTCTLLLFKILHLDLPGWKGFNLFWGWNWVNPEHFESTVRSVLYRFVKHLPFMGYFTTSKRSPKKRPHQNEIT